METKDFVLGYGAGKNSAVSEKIVEEVDAWLDEHITNPDSPPLDRSLTSSSAAAPADMVGDINDEVGNLKNTLNHKADVIYDTVSGDIASFPDGADGLPVKDLTVGIEPVQSGAGDPSPDNVRPISGWTGANVSRTGINIFNETWEKGSINSETGAEEPNAYISRTGYISILPSTLYYYTYTNLGNNMRAFYYDINKNYISTFVAYSNNSFTTPDNAAYLRLHIADGNGIPNTSVNYPSTDHDYHSGTDNITIPISWQTEAGTVYGGTLDVTTGVLTVTMASVDLGTLYWVYELSQFRCNDLTSAISRPADNNTKVDIICSIYPVATRNETYSGNYDKHISVNMAGVVWIPDSDYTDAAIFKSAMSGIQLVYELATPQTYQLDPVTVQTLLGQNNIWADCGPVSVDYPADTKLYIQKINTPTDDDMIADANIASGKYFIINNNLYLSTAAILAGDPIKPGTNCTLTNLAAALNALNS